MLAKEILKNLAHDVNLLLELPKLFVDKITAQKNDRVSNKFHSGNLISP